MIQLKEGCFAVDGKPTYIYSGEIHYFRIAPELWQLHLQRAKEAGLNTVSTYIPWSWHEPHEGKFDFTGRTHPQRNLVRYIDTVRKEGLKFLVRVGPVSNAELKDEGIPAWLFEKYPEVYTRGKEVTNLPHVDLLCYNNEILQDRIGKWYGKLLPIIKKNQWPSGNIILVQLDNEIGMIRWLNKAADYTPYAERLYREFLELKYKDIRQLNTAYGASYASFSELKQPLSGADHQNKNMLWDWMGFYQHYYALYYETLYKRLRKQGIKLPVTANIPQFYDFDVRGRGVYSPMTTMMFRDFTKVAPEVVFGGAYQMRRLDYENFHDIVITTEVVKMITSPGIPSICAELQTGIMRDRPRLYSQDVELNLKTCTAHGLNAVNCYMFSGGANVKGFGGFGTYHEWQAPVNSKGEKQNHFKALEQFGNIMGTFGPAISKTEKHIDTAIGFYPPYYTTEYLTGPMIEEWEWKKMQLFYDGLARLLQLANINYTFIDLQKAPLNELRKQKTLWVFSLEFMDKATQQKLADYVKLGGRLVLNPCLPEQGIAMEPCTAISDFLGVKLVSKRKKPCFVMINGEDCVTQGEICAYSVPENAVIIAKDADSKPCAVEVARGKGKAVVVGFGLNHLYDYHIDVVLALAERTGIKPSIKVDRDLQAVLRQNDSCGFLFLANFHDEPKKTRVNMVIPGEKKAVTFPYSGHLEIDNRRCYIIPLNVKLPSGDIIRYSTVEISGFKNEGGRNILSVSGMAGGEAEIEILTGSVNISLVDGPFHAERLKDSIRLRFPTNGKIQRIQI